MKHFVLALSLVSVMFAQAHQDTAKMYKDMRENGIMMTEKMIPALKEVKACVGDATTYDVAIECTKTIEKIVGKSDEPVYDKEKGWNEYTKKKAVFDLDVAIHESVEANKCYKSSEDYASFQKCVDDAEISY